MLLPYAADLINQYIPWYYLASENIKHQHIPHWVDGLYKSGYPLLAQGESGVLSPVNFIILRFLPFPQSVNFLYLTYFLIAVIGIYLFLRLFKLKAWASILGAIIFVFSGFFVSRYFQPSIIFTAAYLPWGFFLIQKSINNPKILLLLAPLVYLQITAGHLQICFISALSYFAFSLLLKIFYKLKLIFNIKILTILLLGFFMGSVQILPSFKLFMLSERQNWNPLTRFAYSLPPSHLATYIKPDAFGISKPGDDYGFRQFGGGFWEINITIWTIPFVLSLIPLYIILAGKKIDNDKRAMIKIFYVMWLGFILISLGGFFKPNVIIAHIPNFPFRAPARFMLASTFAASCLAAVGFSEIINNFNKKLTTLFFLLVVFSIYFQICNQMSEYFTFVDKDYISKDLKENIRANSLATPLILDSSKVENYSNYELERIFKKEYNKGLIVSTIAFLILITWFKLENSNLK